MTEFLLAKIAELKRQVEHYRISQAGLEDATNSEEVQNPNSISLWEEGMDEEPIVGNEVVYTSIRLPPQLDDEDEIVEHKIVPSFE